MRKSGKWDLVPIRSQNTRTVASDLYFELYLQPSSLPQDVDTSCLPHLIYSYISFVVLYILIYSPRNLFYSCPKLIFWSSSIRQVSHIVEIGTKVVLQTVIWIWFMFSRLCNFFCVKDVNPFCYNSKFLITSFLIVELSGSHTGQYRFSSFFTHYYHLRTI